MSKWETRCLGKHQQSIPQSPKNTSNRRYTSSLIPIHPCNMTYTALIPPTLFNSLQCDHSRGYRNHKHIQCTIHRPTRQMYLNAILAVRKEKKNLYAKYIQTSQSSKSTFGTCKCSSLRLHEWQEHTGVIGYISSLFHLHGDSALHRNVNNFQSLISCLSAMIHFHL